MTTCKNCDLSFDGKFCPNCSQKADTHRFTLLHFGHDFFHALTHTDKGILFLIRELFKRPGYVARDYNAGKRKKYFNPITFLLIMTAIQLFAASKAGFYQGFTTKMHELVEAATPSSKNVADREIFDRQRETSTHQMAMVSENLRTLTLLFIPLLALLTWLFFKRSGHNYAENLVFNVMISGQFMVIFILLAVVPFLIFPGLVLTWFVLNFIGTWIYTFIAYRQFFGQSWARTLVKGLLVQVIYMAAVPTFTFIFFDLFKSHS